MKFFKEKITLSKPENVIFDIAPLTSCKNMSIFFILSLILLLTFTAERESFSAEDPSMSFSMNVEQIPEGAYIGNRGENSNFGNYANSPYGTTDYEGTFSNGYSDNTFSGNGYSGNGYSGNSYSGNGYSDNTFSGNGFDNNWNDHFDNTFNENTSQEDQWSSGNSIEDQQDSSVNSNWQAHHVENWNWQILPTGMMFPSYLAGRKEPRLGCVFTDDFDYGGLWDIQLGGRIPLLRYGTNNAVQPEGWQVEVEGAALLRLDFERNRELAGTDYRAGIFLVRATRRWQFKIGNYHISSHLGDQYILAGFRLPRVQYTRDEIVFGVGFRPIPSIRLYGEFGAAYKTGATTDPIELQFGAEYSAPYIPENNPTGTPFAAIHGHLFQELDYSGYLNLQAGWQWRGKSNDLFRLGVEFFTGCDDQFQFHYYYQKKLGFLVAFDF